MSSTPVHFSSASTFYGEDVEEAIIRHKKGWASAQSPVEQHSTTSGNSRSRRMNIERNSQPSSGYDRSQINRHSKPESLVSPKFSLIGQQAGYLSTQNPRDYEEELILKFRDYNKERPDPVGPYTSPEPTSPYSLSSTNIIHPQQITSQSASQRPIRVPSAALGESVRLDLVLGDDQSSSEDEIPTTRLLDGLNVGTVNGVATVNFSPELKNLLKKKQDQPPSTSDDCFMQLTDRDSKSLRKSYCENDVEVEEYESWSEKMIRSRDIRSAAKQSIAEVERSRADLERELKQILQKRSSVLPPPSPPPPSPPPPSPPLASSPPLFHPAHDGNSHLFRNAEPEENYINHVHITIEGDQEKVSSPLSDVQVTRKVHFTQRPLHKKEPELEIPLVNKELDESAIDDEIDQRVREIELEMERSVLESQQLLEKLQRDVDNTEFELPIFSTINNNPGVKPIVEEQKANLTVAFQPPLRDYNIHKQAKSLGLKHKDYSHIFVPTSSRHSRMKKYQPSSGKVDVRKVSSRINSGKRSSDPKSKKVSSERQPDRPSISVYNVLPGAYDAAPTTSSTTDSQSQLNKLINRKPSQAKTLRKPERVVVKKTTTTFTLGEGGIEENKLTSDLASRESPPTPYQPLETLRLVQGQTKRERATSTSRPFSAAHKVHNKGRVHSAHTSRPPMAKPKERPKSSSTFTVSSQPSSSKAALGVAALGAAALDAAGRRGSTNHEGVGVQVETQPQTELRQDGSAPIRNAFMEDSLATAMSDLDSKPQAHPGISPIMVVPRGRLTRPASVKPNSHTTRVLGAELTTTEPRLNTRPASAKPTARPATEQNTKPNRVRSAPVRKANMEGATVISTQRKPIKTTDMKQLTEIQSVQDRAWSRGINLDSDKLSRALFPPAAQNTSDCQQQFSKNFLSSGLLSSPDKWLKREWLKDRKSGETTSNPSHPPGT